MTKLITYLWKLKVEYACFRFIFLMKSTSVNLQLHVYVSTQKYIIFSIHTPHEIMEKFSLLREIGQVRQKWQSPHLTISTSSLLYNSGNTLISKLYGKTVLHDFLSSIELLYTFFLLNCLIPLFIFKS